MIDISHTDDNESPRVFINGQIISYEGECVFSEGCLSIPQVALEVIRPESILFKYQDINEKWHEEEFDGLLSIIDFKSANRAKKQDQLEKHAIQETAYSVMWNELTNIPIEDFSKL